MRIVCSNCGREVAGGTAEEGVSDSHGICPQCMMEFYLDSVKNDQEMRDIVKAEIRKVLSGERQWTGPMRPLSAEAQVWYDRLAAETESEYSKERQAEHPVK